MIHVKFKNLEKSEIGREAAIERLETITVKFPDLEKAKIDVTLEMHNSPSQPGPDLFSAKVCILTGRYKGIAITKLDANLYVALADVVDHLLEKLNRYGDRARVKKISAERKLSQKQLISDIAEEELT
jgi:ribosome-associated translation inhibitor RaiA